MLVDFSGLGGFGGIIGFGLSGWSVGKIGLQVLG